MSNTSWLKAWHECSSNRSYHQCCYHTSWTRLCYRSACINDCTGYSSNWNWKVKEETFYQRYSELSAQKTPLRQNCQKAIVILAQYIMQNWVCWKKLNDFEISFPEKLRKMSKIGRSWHGGIKPTHSTCSLASGDTWNVKIIEFLLGIFNPWFLWCNWIQPFRHV